MEYVEPVTLIGIAIATGLAGIFWRLLALQRDTTRYRERTEARIERLEQWRIAHDGETKKYQEVLREIQQELAYLRGIRDTLRLGPSGGD